MKCDFSFKHYQEIIQMLKKQNYRFCFFNEKPNPQIKQVYWRHDVDLCLKKALKIAEIERKNQIRATYFIRLQSPFYNIFSDQAQKLILKINQLGHQLGLHFEENISTNRQKIQINQKVKKNLQILKTHFKIGQAISFHRPHPKLRNKKFKNFISTYEPAFFSQTKYLSDSRGYWQENCPCQWLGSRKLPNNVQILTHPVWWSRSSKQSPCQHLQNCLKNHFKDLDIFLAQDNQIYKKFLS